MAQEDASFQGGTPTSHRETHPDSIRQQLDADSLALSRIPADPLVKKDPLELLLQPWDTLAEKSHQALRFKYGLTFTFLNQYATVAPDGVRHNQPSGRFDLAGVWTAYEGESSSGYLSVLARSASNIGISHRFNLSDSLGSVLYLNCLQGGGTQQPITLNILYWRQDLFRKRLSLYVGKIHPNEYITLSMFNNDERTQFLNGANDGNLAVASDGTYAGGGAVEWQVNHHVYLHGVVVDTEGGSQYGLKTMADKKYMEAAEFGWSSGSPGKAYRHYRIGLWRDDTKDSGSGFGGGVGFDHEFRSGWTTFGRAAFGTRTGTAIKNIYGTGIAHVKPFDRKGDMFGLALNYSEPSKRTQFHESVIETFLPASPDPKRDPRPRPGGLHPSRQCSEAVYHGPARHPYAGRLLDVPRGTFFFAQIVCGKSGHMCSTWNTL